MDNEFLEALADRLTVDDLCTYLDISSEDLVAAFKGRVRSNYDELSEIIGWTTIISGE